MKKSSYTAANAFPAKLLHLPAVKFDKIIPLHIQLCLTNLCNLNCSFCSCANRKKNTVLNLNCIKKAITAYKKIGTKAVTITGGGEPLLHPQINNIITYIDSKNIRIGLVTNGTQFHRLSTDSIAKLTWCRISISDNRKLRYSEIPAHLPVDWAFSYVVTKKPDYENIDQIIEFANKHKFTHVRIVADLLDLNIDIATVKKKMKGKDDLVIYQPRKKYTKGKKKCLISLLKPVIAADGKIYPCCGVQYALENPSLDFEKTMLMGIIDHIEKIYINQLYFNGSICTRCYYDEYNYALNLLTQKIDHLEFV